MNIYLPMKNDLLDKGEGTIWTGGGLKEPEITNFEGVRCAKFDGQARLRLQDTTLIKSLTIWTVQVWIYCTEKISSYTSRIFSNYSLGDSNNDSFFEVGISSNTEFHSFGVTYDTSINLIGNGWHYIKITSDGQKIYTYLDKQKIGENSTNTKRFNHNNITIGDENGNYGWDTKFHGYMTQFKFSDKYNDNDLLLNDSKFIYINKNNEAWAMV